MGLREQQKAARKRQILEAATKLFRQSGFQKQTTVHAIAREAGVSWATIYKYYKCKDDIISAVIRPDLEKVFAEAERVIANPPDRPSEAMLALIACYTRFRDEWRDRRFLLLMSTQGMMPNAGAVHDLGIWADARIHAQILSLLQTLRAKGCVPAAANLADMAAITFAVFNQGYQLYITDPSKSPDAAIADIVRLIKSLYQPWDLASSRDARSARKTHRCARN